MKSSGVSVHLAPYAWIDRPGLQFLYMSYAANLAIRDSVKARRVIESPWYQANWGDRYRLTGDQNTKTRFDNTEQGYRLATSVTGQLTGDGGDIVVIDDPHNVMEGESEANREQVLALWDEALPTRLNNPQQDAFIVVR